MTVATTPAIVQLCWVEKDKTVTVTPEDENRFVTNVEHAIKACKAYNEQIRFGRQFKELLEKLACWINLYQEKTELSIVTIRDSRLLFVVVRKDTAYDEEIESSLIDLDISIANDPELNLIKLSVIDLPNCSPESLMGFLDPQVQMVYKHVG
ncbi:MAG: hypothetical protein U9P14_12475 [Gemmatimonadota bacterium]|nr:hypothetical protein [Gemmatimonadota bacterium]